MSIKKLPIWTVDSYHYVVVKPGFATHEREWISAGTTKAGHILNCWVKDLPPVREKGLTGEYMVRPPWTMPLPSDYLIIK